MAQPLPPPGYEDIHRSEFARMFGRMVGARLLLAPVAASFAVLLAVWETEPWRRVALVGLAASMISFTVVEAWRYRRFGMTARAADLNLAAGVLGQLIGTGVTGGLESPVLPVMLLFGLFQSMIMVDRRWYYWALVGVQLSALWAFGYLAVHGLVPGFTLQVFGGGVRAGHGDLHLWTTASVMTLAVVMAHTLGRGLREVFDSMLRRSLEANEQLRREHGDQARELVALSGEIAHELKNPMSSVKGLAALLSQNVPEGKGAERLSVLRRELDRMQSVLEEFLNFSRPLVPLSVETADLAALCEEVAELHEGLAREKGVELKVAAGETTTRCDPRKVRQILVNLVQNAVDASPAGRAVELELTAGAAGTTVRVMDRGPGIDEAVLLRLFEPGTTTKARGTGLGLTIARALARQHGGELTLSARDGGGCVALLALPVEPKLPAQDHGE